MIVLTCLYLRFGNPFASQALKTHIALANSYLT